jgi:Tfp pilus assembly protein PilN
MKHDINLLQKKKATQYSGKKLGTILLIVLLLGGLLFAGIKLPIKLLDDAQIRLTALDEQIADQTAIDQKMTEKTQKNAILQQELTQLETLTATRQDVAKYMAAVEASLPTSATITYISLEENTMSISGIVPRDDVLATFALRLRETQVFSSVFVSSSTTPEENSSTAFTISALLPTPLSDATEVTDGSDSEDKAGGGSDSQDDGSGGGSNDDALIADDGANTVASTDVAQNGGTN